MFFDYFNRASFFDIDNSLVVWNMNVYLYEAARHRSVPMMLHALALGGDKNFVNESDHKRTPLIETILSVSFNHRFRKFSLIFDGSRDPLQLLNIF